MVVGKNEESRNLGVLLGLRDFFCHRSSGTRKEGQALGANS